MKTEVYVFCHGFDLLVKFWQPLLTYFKDVQIICFNLGYFGNTKSTSINSKYDNCEYIGIGHSLGFAKIMHEKIIFNIIELNVFTKFLGTENFLYNRCYRECILFKKQFFNNPRVMLVDFYTKCELPKFCTNFTSF